MCGIGAFIKLKGNAVSQKFVNHAIENMLLELQKKGEDATGLCAIFPDHEETVKMPIKADKFITTPEFHAFMKKNWKAKIILTHCRHATRGNPKNNINNHPLESESAVVLHNGIINDDSESIINSLENGRWNKEIETDSYFINKVAEIYGVHAIPDIRGSMAIILYDKKNKQLALYRNSCELNVGYCPSLNTIIVATLEDAIKSAFSEKVYKYGLIALEEKKTKSFIQDLKSKTLFITDLDKINFTRNHSYITFHEEDVEGYLGDYYDNVCVRLGKLYAVKITENTSAKVDKAIEELKLVKKNEVFMLTTEELKNFILTVKKHKKKKVKYGVNDWDKWGHRGGGYYG